MKKIYETPVCQAISMDCEDILTASSFVEFVKGGEGSFDEGGAVIEWW